MKLPSYSINKKVIIFIIIAINLIGWAFIIDQWQKESAKEIGSAASDLGYHIPSSVENWASVELTEFNPDTGEASFVAHIYSPQKFPGDYTRVVYNRIFLVYSGPNGVFEYININSEQFENGKIEYFLPERIGTGGLVSIEVETLVKNYYFKAYPIPSGYYPFEEFKAEIYILIEGEYFKPSGESAVLSRPFDVITFRASPNQSMRIDTKTGTKLRSFALGSSNRVVGFVELSFRELIFPQIVIPLVFIVLTIASLSIFWIPDISSMIQIVVAIIFGIWGLSSVILPDYLNKDLRFGIEQSILLVYFMLCLTTTGRVIFIWHEMRTAGERSTQEAKPLAKDKSKVNQNKKTKTKKRFSRKKTT